MADLVQAGAERATLILGARETRMRALPSRLSSDRLVDPVIKLLQLVDAGIIGFFDAGDVRAAGFALR